MSSRSRDAKDLPASKATGVPYRSTR